MCKDLSFTRHQKCALKLSQPISIILTFFQIQNSLCLIRTRNYAALEIMLIFLYVSSFSEQLNCQKKWWSTTWSSWLLYQSDSISNLIQGCVICALWWAIWHLVFGKFLKPLNWGQKYPHRVTFKTIVRWYVIIFLLRYPGFVLS